MILFYSRIPFRTKGINMGNSPWGQILEQEALIEGVWYVSTALHGGLMVTIPKIKELSLGAQEHGIQSNSYVFFEKDLAIHYINIELGLALFSPLDSLVSILKVNPNYENQNITKEDFLAAREEIRLSESAAEQAFLNQDLDYIQSVTELDDGWKAITIEDREFLLSDYPVKPFISQSNMLGEVTNFDKTSVKSLPLELLPNFLLDKVDQRNVPQLIAKASKVKNSYILEIYLVLELPYSGDYLGEINLFNYPDLIAWWCHNE